MRSIPRQTAPSPHRSQPVFESPRREPRPCPFLSRRKSGRTHARSGQSPRILGFDDADTRPWRRINPPTRRELPQSVVEHVAVATACCRGTFISPRCPSLCRGNLCLGSQVGRGVYVVRQSSQASLRHESTERSLPHRRGKVERQETLSVKVASPTQKWIHDPSF